MASKATVESPPGVPPEAAADVPDAPKAADAEQAGGTYINTGGTGLTLIAPPGGTVRPGRVIDLPYTPSHRDFRLATAAEIKASAAADAAETAAAAEAANPATDTSGREA